MLSDWLHPGRAYKNAQGTVQQGYDTAQGQQQPYADYGTSAGGTLSEQLNKLMNPQGLQDEWNKSYETSEAAKQDMAQAQEQGLGAASSMGLMGSSSALQSIQSGAHNIMNKDRQQYLDDLMNKYKTGVGIGQGMYNTGAQTAGQMGQQSIQGAQDQANLGIGGSQAGANRIGQFGSMIGNLGGSYLTGGMGQGGYGRGMLQPTPQYGSY